MLAREQNRATEAQPFSQRDTAAAAGRRALDLLGRASADWRNGGGCESGALHWPVAISFARRELRQALEALESEAGLRELLLEAAQRLRGWSAGAGPDGKLIGRIEEALGLLESDHPAASARTDKRAHILHWLDRHGDDPQHAVHAKVAREWLRRQAAEQPANDCPGDCLDSLDTDDARAGLAWYNSATVTERRHWHQVARSAVPADAWEAYKAGASTP